MLIRFGAGVDSRVRLIGAAASANLRDGSARSGQVNATSAGGFSKTSSVPVGYRDNRAYAPALSDGGMAGRAFGTSAEVASISGQGTLAATLTAQATTTASGNIGAQIYASLTAGASTSGAIGANGALRSNVLIGASPSAIDIADQVWSRSMTPFNQVGTFGEQLKNLTGGGGGGGGGPSASQIADAVWAYVTRTLTASSDPTAAVVASQVRTELAVELGRLDATISSRLAAAGYTAPANSDVAAIKAKTDRLTFNVSDHLAANVHQIQAAPLSDIRSGLAIETTSQAIKAKTDTLVNTDLSGVATSAQVSSLNNISQAQVRAQVDAGLAAYDAPTKAELDSGIASIPQAPSASANASAVRTELATELARVDASISSRNAVAPDNANIAAIKAKVDTLENADFTGIATSSEIAEVKKNTDLIPAAL